MSTYLKVNNTKDSVMSQAKENLKSFLKKIKTKMPNKENIDVNKENVNVSNKVAEKVFEEKVIPCEKSKDSEMDKVIVNLRTSYHNMKQERVKTEKDIEHLENKLKLLQSEEMSAYKKFQNEKKFKEEWESARNKVQDFKKFCGEAKIKRKQECEELSKKIKEMKEYIQKSMNVKKMMKFQENRLSSLQMKQQKLENDELRRSLIKEECQKNKRMAESVKLREKNYLEKKKVDGEEKKKKLKKELEEKLLAEQRMKKMMEERLNTLEVQETGLLKKIRNSDDIDKADKKYRSLSTGASAKTKAKGAAKKM